MLRSLLKSASDLLQSGATKVVSTSTAIKESNREFIHQVKIINLPPHEMGSVKKLLQKHGLHDRYKKSPKWNYTFVNFPTEEAARSAMTKLEGIQFKNRVITTEYFKVSEKEFASRFEARKKAQETSGAEKEGAVEEDLRTPAEKLADQVTPLYKIPYEDQIAKKHKLGPRYLNTLRKKLNAMPDLTDASRAQIAWTDSRENYCEILPIIQSPSVNGYRTKCEFTIGKDLGGEKTVGFLLGLYREGITAVLSPEESLHVSEKAKQVAKAMENYVKKSNLDVYDRAEKVGVWRTIMTKTQRTGDVMVLIQINAKELTDTQLAEEKQNLANYWNELKEKKEINTTTLMLQIWNGDSNGITDRGETDILTGDGYVYEEILGCRFRISSSAFFQVNTPATELLYAKCAEWCKSNNSSKQTTSTLLDLCCGTGTIGITMAKSADKVIGIDIVPEAIADAKANATMNKIDNVQYYASKVEEKIGDIVVATAENGEDEKVVAILDPPRSGVHTSVIRAIRESNKIQKVIYISCDAKQAMQNFIGLCRPTSNRFKGLPFKPSKAVSIDLFPHTEHFEFMVEFVRPETIATV